MTKPSEKQFDLNFLLHPAQAFRQPVDVLDDPDLTLCEKRAILASWASDACAVEDAPALRRPAGAPTVTFDDVMDALKRLDGAAVEKLSYGKLMTRAQRLKAIFQPNTPWSQSRPILLGRSRKWHSRKNRGGGHSPTA